MGGAGLQLAFRVFHSLRVVSSDHERHLWKARAALAERGDELLVDEVGEIGEGVHRRFLGDDLVLSARISALWERPGSA